MILLLDGGSSRDSKCGLKFIMDVGQERWRRGIMLNKIGNKTLNKSTREEEETETPLLLSKRNMSIVHNAFYYDATWKKKSF